MKVALSRKDKKTLRFFIVAPLLFTFAFSYFSYRADVGNGWSIIPAILLLEIPEIALSIAGIIISIRRLTKDKFVPLTFFALVASVYAFPLVGPVISAKMQVPILAPFLDPLINRTLVHNQEKRGEKFANSIAINYQSLSNVFSNPQEVIGANGSLLLLKSGYVIEPINIPSSKTSEFADWATKNLLNRNVTINLPSQNQAGSLMSCVDGEEGAVTVTREEFNIPDNQTGICSVIMNVRVSLQGQDISSIFSGNLSTNTNR